MMFKEGESFGRDRTDFDTLNTLQSRCREELDALVATI